MDNQDIKELIKVMAVYIGALALCATLLGGIALVGERLARLPTCVQAK